VTAKRNLPGVLAVVAAGAVGVVPSCHSEPQSGGDSSSHWLRECNVDSECGALSCVCGQCTRHCSASSECASLSGASTCAQSVALGCDRAPVCVATCNDSSACSLVRSGLECKAGQCVPLNDDAGPSDREASTSRTDAAGGSRDATTEAAPGMACSGAPCGKGRGSCCAGSTCAGIDFYNCFRATRDSTFCLQNSVGECYPDGVTGCYRDSTGIAGCPSNILFGTAAPNETCCAPLGNQGAYACADPATNPQACASDGRADASPASGDAAPPVDGALTNDGTCAFACAGVCSAGRCQVTVVSAPVSDFAVSGAYVYWTAFQDGVVMRVPVDGGSPTTVASGRAGAFRIAVDATSVYYTVSMTYPDLPDGAIVKVPLSGGSQTTLASTRSSPLAITLDAQNVYWTAMTPDYLAHPVQGTGTVMKVPLNGGPATVLATGLAEPLAIAVTASHVYWTDPNGIMTVPITGGTPVTLPTGNQPNGFTVDTTRIYWTGDVIGGPSSEAIRKMDFAGGSVVTLASWDYYAGPLSVAVDASSVYWVNRQGLQGLGSIMKVPIDGGTAVALASKPVSPLYLAVDASSVYWSTDNAIVKVTPK
jgi:hypothetical protein